MSSGVSCQGVNGALPHANHSQLVKSRYFNSYARSQLSPSVLRNSRSSSKSAFMYLSGSAKNLLHSW